MEVSLVGKSQVKTGLANRKAPFCMPKSGEGSQLRKFEVSFGQRCGRRRRRDEKRLAMNALQIDAIGPQRVPHPSASLTQSHDGVRLYVGLPLDAVADDNSINHAKAIVAGLKALKLLGVEGVELPVWWGIVEKEGMGKYEWSGYLSLAEMVHKAGLKLHVSLCFHACKRQPRIPLPGWVMRVGEDESSSIFFTDRSGQQYRDCLSLSVDELPVLNGKTPMKVYGDFCESFKSSFSLYIGSTITGISMGLGPDGQLQYPSFQGCRDGEAHGVGEFQCYDRSMLKLLKEQAEASGNPLWGLGGPHDVPHYNESPSSNNFFKDHGGSWKSPYGDFFLSWYSNQLVSHGDRLLSLASSIFGDSDVTVCGKVPLVYSWYKTASHPSELTAGYYNTVIRDGYEAVANMFAKNSCRMILPGMDLPDDSARLLLEQILVACRKHGVKAIGENSLLEGGFEQINNLSGTNDIDPFFYQRMGARFFSPEYFPLFTSFVRSTKQPQLHGDDVPRKDEQVDESLPVKSELGVQMQTA